MSGRRFALLVLLLLGGGLGAVIAGIPNVSPEMETTVSAGNTGVSETSTSTTPFRGTTAPTRAAVPVHAPEDITAIVLNGASMEGAAGEISDLLSEAGYSMMTPSNTDSFEATTVFFREDYEGDAEVIAAAINPEVTVVPLDAEAFDDVDDVDDANVVVVLGEDYPEITPVGDEPVDEEPPPDEDTGEEAPPEETPLPSEEEPVTEEAAV